MFITLLVSALMNILDATTTFRKIESTGAFVTWFNYLNIVIVELSNCRIVEFN